MVEIKSITEAKKIILALWPPDTKSTAYQKIKRTLEELEKSVREQLCDFDKSGLTYFVLNEVLGEDKK